MATKVFLRTVLSLLMLSAFSSCFDSGADTSEEDPEEAVYQAEKAERDKIKARVAELRAEKKELENTLKELKSTAGKQGDLAKTEVAVLSDLEATRLYSGRVAALSAELDASLTVWREATRKSFRGVQLPEITTIDGKKYSSVVINGVTDDSIIIEHTGGMETIPVMQLPVSLRKNVIHESTILSEQGF